LTLPLLNTLLSVSPFDVVQNLEDDKQKKS
jgi:hypothetical protein